jgi:glucan-binding YG repeat protein
MGAAMRIKIKGEITGERLAEALQAALEKYEAVRPGTKIYGANLYLTAYDADGLPFDLVDHRGESLSITIEAKSGELVKPALTAEGERRRKEALDEAKRKEEEAQANAKKRERETLDEHERKGQERKAKEAQAREQFRWLNETTAQLLKNDPERFIAALNNAVQTAWQKCQPLTKQGAKKGQPLPLPTFSTHAGGLLLSVETWKNPRRVLNPICTLQHGELTPFWAHEAWDAAIGLIGEVLSAERP